MFYGSIPLSDYKGSEFLPSLHKERDRERERERERMLVRKKFSIVLRLVPLLLLVVIKRSESRGNNKNLDYKR